MLEGRACALAQRVGEDAQQVGISPGDPVDPDCGELLVLCLAGGVVLSDLFRE